MNFQLTEQHLYWWPVTVRLPDPHPDNAGKVLEQSFKMQFEALDQDEVLANQLEGEALHSSNDIVRHERAQLHQVCKDWTVCDGKGQPIPFGREALDRALQKSWFRLAVWEAYSLSLTGEAAQMGNSQMPLATGPSGG